VSKTRMRRIRRLVKLRERCLNVARGHLSDATRQERSARMVHERAEDSWGRRADEVVDSPPDSVGDMAEQREHLRALRDDVERARAKWSDAASTESQRRDEVLEARRELEKMERWSEEVGEAMRLAEAKRERVESDAVAAESKRRSMEMVDEDSGGR